MKVIIYALFFIFPLISHADIWSQAKLISSTQSQLLNEVSGMESSFFDSNLLYFINDSGNPSFFYIKNHESIKEIKLENATNNDFEDLSSYQQNNTNYLVIGDIGDNHLKREFITLYFIKERKWNNLDSINPSYTLHFRYPKKIYNSEAFAIHPDGVLFLITKDPNGKSRLYTKKIHLNTPSHKHKRLNLKQKINLEKILNNLTHDNNAITSLDISPNGRKLTILTYSYAIEFLINDDYSLDLESFEYITLHNLPQQESIMYGKNGKTLFYTTETHNKNILPIYQLKRK